METAEVTRMKELVQKLNEAAKAYYQEDREIMSNREYDALYDELEQCLPSHPQKYDLGECEFHLAMVTEDFAAAKAKHEAMGCICYVNEEMGIYFIEDPDGYWIEIIPPRLSGR